MYLYKNIKELRLKSNLSQAAIAEVLDIKPQQYQRYEYGQREIPVHLLIKLADYYDVSLDYITGRTEV